MRAYEFSNYCNRQAPQLAARTCLPSSQPIEKGSETSALCGVARPPHPCLRHSVRLSAESSKACSTCCRYRCVSKVSAVDTALLSPSKALARGVGAAAAAPRTPVQRALRPIQAEVVTITRRARRITLFCLAARLPYMVRRQVEGTSADAHGTVCVAVGPAHLLCPMHVEAVRLSAPHSNCGHAGLLKTPSCWLRVSPSSQDRTAVPVPAAE